MFGSKSIGLVALAARVPGMLGFDPAGSVVLVGLTGARPLYTVAFTLRVDLPTMGEARALADELTATVTRHRLDAVALLGFCAKGGGSAVAGIVAIEQALKAAGVPVAGPLEIRDGRARYFGEHEWEAVPASGESVSVARDDLVAAMAEGAGAVDVARAAVALGQPPTTAAAMAAWRRVLGVGGGEPMATDYAAAALSSVDTTVRDAVIAWAVPNSLPETEWPQEVRESLAAFPAAPPWADRRDEARQKATRERMTQVCQMMPGPLCPGVCIAAAFILWWLGDGARARIACDRALAVEPDYRLGRILEVMLDRGISPFQAPEEPAPGATAQA